MTHASGPALRVVTYNVLHGIDVRRRRVDLTAAVRLLDALGPDLVAVQEVDRDLARSGGVDQAGALGRALGLHAVFAPALLGDPDVRWQVPPDPGAAGPAYGVGLLSRHPLRSVTVLRLPGGGDGGRRPARAGAVERTPAWARAGWDREPRVGLVAEAVTPMGAVRVATTHLSYLPWRGLRQLRALLAGFDGRLPTLLAGDLNLPRRLVRLAAGDAWRHAAPAPTYPSWRPRTQPDQVLVTPDVAVLRTTATEAVVSDHRPLVVDVRLEASAGTG